MNDNGASVDCIIVLGSMKAAKYRVPAAAKAFFSGRSEKIMLCGGKTRNFSGESMAEADNMYQKALELGVPEASLIVERNSQNTIENILCSLLELQRAMWLNQVKSVLLVTTTYHMRRSLQRLTKGNMINNKKMDCQPYRKRRPAVKRAAFLRDRERRKRYQGAGPN